MSFGVWTVQTSARRDQPLAQSLIRKKNEEPKDHALGRSQGGFGSKLHLIVEGHGLPLGFSLSPGQAHESKYFEKVLESIHLPHLGRKRPISRPHKIAADKAYSVGRIRKYLKKRGILPVIPRKANEKFHRHLRFDKTTYRKRNIIERSINWMKERRRIGTRFEKLAVNFTAMIQLTMIQRYFRELELINTP
jgi:transposase